MRRIVLGFPLAGLATLALMLIPHAASAEAPHATITVTTTADGTGGPECTLRDAIAAANTDTAAGGCSGGHRADTIDFSLSGQITLGSTLPAVTSDVTIDGSGQSLVVSGEGAVRVLEVRAGASLTLAALTIADGNAANAGGILNSGSLLVTNSTFSGNSAENFGSGGAIWNTARAMLTVGTSSFSENGAPEGTGHVTLGAGIYNDGRALVENSTFSGNGADHGGGIFNAAGGRLTLRASTLSGNSAGQGGAIHNLGPLSIENSNFSGNTTTIGSGGAVSNGSTLTVANSTFSGNCASGGGGIANGATLTVANSTFSENCADGGGAISSGGTLTVADSTFSDNYAYSGAGISMVGSGNIRRSTFAGNSAQSGAGINNGGTLTVSNSTFSGNSAYAGGYGGPGGGIENRSEATLTVMSSTFSGNSAYDAYGGGIANLGTATLKNTIVAGSSQGGNCSGVLTASSTSDMSDDPTCGPGFIQVGLAELMLGVLGDNGGLTQTIALGPSSVAIDAGDNAAAAGLTTDQRGRGFPRIVNGRVDIGAFEVQRR